MSSSGLREPDAQLKLSSEDPVRIAGGSALPLGRNETQQPISLKTSKRLGALIMFQRTVLRDIRPRRPLKPSDYRRQRRQTEAQNLLRDLEAVLGLYPRIQLLGPDPMVETILRYLRLSEAGLATVAGQVGSKHVTFVAVPSSAWRSQVQRATLQLLRQQAKMSARRVLFVPHAVLRQQPRLANARLIASCSHVSVAPRDRIAVMSHLARDPGSTLEDCALIVRHNDPVESILGMVARGILTIRTDEHIGPFSRVDLISSSEL